MDVFGLSLPTSGSFDLFFLIILLYRSRGHHVSHHQVTATDGGTPPRSATASVVVVIQDVNDNDPVFSPPQYEVELAEDEPPGTPVVTVTATDADEDNR